LLDLTMQALQAAMAGLQARQRITAQNIANAETPGYLAGRVSFESSLRDAVAAGHPSSMQMNTHVSLDATSPNGNNVSLDEENVSLIDTGLRYQLAVDAMNTKFRILRESLRRES
jgi:flagellar basal-body rod protein FlgB